jgi:cell division protein FtsL
MQALQHKMRTVSQVEAVLLLIVIVTMAVGRYIHL